MKAQTLSILGVVVLAVIVAASFVVFNPKGTVLPTFGALSGPDIPSPYLQWGGVQHWAGSTVNLVAGTSTPAAIQSPAATSTLQSVVCRFQPASTSAKVITIAKATTAFATTTKLGDCTLAAGAFGTCVGSSTSAVNLDGIGVFGPNQYIVIGMQGGQGNGALEAPVGACEAEWNVI